MGLFKQLKINDSVGYTYSGAPKPLTFTSTYGDKTEYFNYRISNDGDILVWTNRTDSIVEINFGSFRKTYVPKLMSRLFWERVFKLIGYNYSELSFESSNLPGFITNERINSNEVYGFEYSSNTWKAFNINVKLDKAYGFII